MRVKRTFLAVFATLVLAAGAGFYANPAAVNEIACKTGVASCGKCGDGYCNKRCGETATTCPRDCGGVPSTKQSE